MDETIDVREEFRATVRDFVLKHCDDRTVMQWERERQYPAEVCARMAELGWLAIPYPEDVGGAGGSIVDMCILAEELARASYDLASAVGLTMFCGLTVLRHGTAEQVERYVRPALEGRSRFAIAITEPDSGSDAASLRTRATPFERGWRIDGQKVFITGANIPGTVMLLAARSESGTRKQDGISVFLIPNDLPGITIRRLSTLGRNIVGTNEVFLEGVVIPDDAVVGTRGAGWSVLKSGLLYERLYVSAAYLGSAQAVLDAALLHARTREQFGRPIGSFQAIGHLLADLQTRVDAARLLVYHAADRVAAGEVAVREVAEAKLFGSETLKAVCAGAMQVLGGYGYITDSTVQRHFNDAQAATITAGTSQVQRSIIARCLGLRAS